MIILADERVAGRVRAASRAAAVAVAGLGAVVLVGWGLDVRTLKSVGGELIAMNPVTAVGFVLLGVALWLAQDGRRQRAMRWARAFAVTAAAVGAQKVAEYVHGSAEGIDHLLFRSQLLAEPFHNRMAPNTAVCFLLAGSALALADVRTRWGRPSHLLAVAVAVSGLVALLGYAYSLAVLYRVSAFIPMAVHTATGFVVLAVGVLCARPDVGLTGTFAGRGMGSAGLRRSLALVVVIPALLGWLVLWSERRMAMDTAFTIALLTSAVAVVFVALLWWNAVALNRADAERRSAEDEARRKNALLEEAVTSERAAHAALKATHAALQATQAALVQAEKLAGLGQMVAGVAHEINNPLSFVSNNVAVLQRDLAAVAGLLAKYRGAADLIRERRPELAAELAALEERIDLEYTLSNLPELLARSRDGLKRIQQIVKDLRDFARLDQSDLQEADVNQGIESTINIIRGKAKKHGVELVADLGAVRPVECFPSKVNQVVMNLLSNAIDASAPGTKITVRTGEEDGGVWLAVADQGSGIPADVRAKVFDPFFTTKPVGEGTGLGLSISYGIVKDHGGRIDLESAVGKGSTFTVHLPRKNRPRSASRPGSDRDEDAARSPRRASVPSPGTPGEG